MRNVQLIRDGSNEMYIVSKAGISCRFISFSVHLQDSLPYAQSVEVLLVLVGKFKIPLAINRTGPSLEYLGT